MPYSYNLMNQCFGHQGPKTKSPSPVKCSVVVEVVRRSSLDWCRSLFPQPAHTPGPAWDGGLGLGLWDYYWAGPAPPTYVAPLPKKDGRAHHSTTRRPPTSFLKMTSTLLPHRSPFNVIVINLPTRSFEHLHYFGQDDTRHSQSIVGIVPCDGSRKPPVAA